jgi:2,4-dienoyl-CoA reductase [(3E)-enoyl-CoA-producing], peroxisomal
MSVFAREMLKGRAALVTGGGTGIGRGIALALAAHGCDVAITSRRAEHIDPTAHEIGACGVRTIAHPADVREPAAIAQAIDATVAAFGHLDVIVNNAAGNFLCAADQLSPNGFGVVVDIDLKGTFNTCRAALPHLKTRGGTILNISATLHYGGTPGQLHVSAAKAGIDALTRNLAVEWGPLGIRVNGIAPGAIDGTEGVGRLLPGELRDRAARVNPLGRLGTIDDIANAALFLCSDAAAHVNGAILVVDGGQWLRTDWMTLTEERRDRD